MAQSGRSRGSAEQRRHLNENDLQALADLKRVEIASTDERRTIYIQVDLRSKKDIDKAIINGKIKNLEAHKRRLEKKKKRQKINRQPKPPKERKRGALDVKNKFYELHNQHFQTPAALWGVKEMSLAKKLVAHYGIDAVLEAVGFFFRNWSIYYAEGWINTPEPNMSLFWGMRNRVFPDAHKGRVNSSVTAGEYSARNEDDTEEDDELIGW